MATGGEVQGRCPPGSVGSEDMEHLKCLAWKMTTCIDCQDYLCEWCFKVHTVPKPAKNHQLLDKEQMLQSQIRTRPKNKCTEKCSLHEDEIIKYFCTLHSKLGCTVCITLDHTTCKGVQYIPHVAKALSNNEKYRQVESQLKSALEAFEKIADNVQQHTEELVTSCDKALEKIKEYRRKVEEAFDKIEADLVEQAQSIKSEELKDLAAINVRYKQTHEELQAALAKIEALRNTKQDCSLYTEMMRTKDKIVSMDAQIKEADVYKIYRECQIKFSPNQGTLDSLKNSEVFGTMSGSSKGAKVNRCKGTIVSAKYAHDINVKTKTDTNSSWITGLYVFPVGRLVLADNSNSKIKTVNAQSGQVLVEQNLPTKPWDVTAIDNNKVAVTMPHKKKIAIVTVGDNNLSLDRSLTVSGTCYGVDYRNSKLAVSFYNPNKVQVLNLQGTVLHNISTDKKGIPIFTTPHYLTYGQDDTTLYVTNYGSNNVVCVKLDGTVEATYADSDFKYPLKLSTDNNGNVYVCTHYSHQVHQISKYCKNIQVLLPRDDSLCKPFSISFSEGEDKLYVGMENDDNVKVFNIERRPVTG